jgi:biotin carboxyl carrier protein
MSAGPVTFEIAARGGTDRVSVERGPEGFLIRPAASGRGAVTLRLQPLAGAEWWRVTVGDTSIPVRLRRAEGAVHVIIGAERVTVEVRRALPVPSRRARAAAAGGAVEVRAPMPGLVITTPAQPGQLIDRGSAVAIVEAMKMQMEVPSPVAGRVDEVRVRPGQEVAGEQVLAVIRMAPEGSP